jgi:uncharacterized protein YjbJ (UPF0337 family)
VSNDGRQDQTAGKFKRKAGEVMGDDDMRSEGKAQENKGDVKRKTEKVTDKAKGAVRGITGKDD